MTWHTANGLNYHSQTLVKERPLFKLMDRQTNQLLKYYTALENADRHPSKLTVGGTSSGQIWVVIKYPIYPWFGCEPTKSTGGPEGGSTQTQLPPPPRAPPPHQCVRKPQFQPSNTHPTRPTEVGDSVYREESTLEPHLAPPDMSASAKSMINHNLTPY